MRIVIVSEDPAFIVAAQAIARSTNSIVVGCLGPAQTPCELDGSDTCPLAARSDVAIVDSPRSGVFSAGWRLLPAAHYVRRLAARCPDTKVILCGAPIGLAGPTGEVTIAADRAVALDLMRCLISVRRARVPRHSTEGATERQPSHERRSL